MPKAKRGTRPASKTLIVLQHGAKRVIVPRPASYFDAIAEASRQFARLPKSMIRFQTDALDFLDGQAAEISRQVWDEVFPLVSVLKISVEPLPGKEETDSRSSLDPEHSRVLDVRNVSQSVLQSSKERGDATAEAPASGARPFPVSPPLTHAVARKDVIPGPNFTETSFGGALLGSSPVTRSSGSVESDPELEKFHVTVVNGEGEVLKFAVTSQTRAFKVLERAARLWGMDPADVRLHYDGIRVTDHTLEELDIEPNQVFLLSVEKKGGKPVIYLLPPEDTNINAHVELELVPQWSFSAIYPSTSIKILQNASGAPAGQKVSWDVEAQPGGNLVDRRTRCEVAYLFWEAETNSHLPSAPSSSRSVSSGEDAILAEKFDPLTSDLATDNSVLLSIANVPEYLDNTLKVLGLHVEARTSFITYWLPSLLKHAYVALRFVPQHSYGQAAPLRITPKPDVITRVFMLFKGVDAIDMESLWGEATKRAKDDVRFWKKVVGVRDIAPDALSSLFRVLEWGGMEVRRR